jgi:hypothetical protein
LTKKNNLLRMIGPDTQPPPLRNVNVPGFTAAALASVPTMPSLRNCQKPAAAKLFAPLRVTLLMPPPMKLPWRTSNGATLTCTCSMASSEIGATPVRSPGWPPRPNELLKYDPSIVMLFMRLSWRRPSRRWRAPCGRSIERFDVVGIAMVSRVTAWRPCAPN